MTSRERVIKAINHLQPDRVPIDIGATGQTGMSASVIYKLREALKMEQKPIKITEIYQILGEVDKELRDYIGCDVIGLNGTHDMFGNKMVGSQPFRMMDGTPCTVSETFRYEMKNGECFAYAQGDTSLPPSAKMPAGGCFFDGIVRNNEFDEDDLTPEEDWKEAFSVMSDESALHYEQEAKRLFEETDYAIIGNLGGGGLGDAAILPGPAEKHPKGIRNMEDWLMAHVLYPEYVEAVFEMQTQVMLKNLEIYRQAVGDRIQIIWISGTDFGTQNGEFVSPKVFRELYKPFYKRINDWVHQNTSWKTFYHTCGSIYNIMPDIIEMGVDIVNPVQVSAVNMDAVRLKNQFGNDIVFWGGGVDTQKTLPFGTPQEVYDQVKERMRIFGSGGGYVFGSIHNIVAKTPVENIIAMLNAFKDFNFQI